LIIITAEGETIVLTSKDYAAVRPRARELETQLLKFQGLVDRYEAATIAITIALIERERWQAQHATRSSEPPLVVRSVSR
jgi:hypothetical protein